MRRAAPLLLLFSSCVSTGLRTELAGPSFKARIDTEYTHRMVSRVAFDFGPTEFDEATATLTVTRGESEERWVIAQGGGAEPFFGKSSAAGQVLAARYALSATADGQWLKVEVDGRSSSLAVEDALLCEHSPGPAPLRELMTSMLRGAHGDPWRRPWAGKPEGLAAASFVVRHPADLEVQGVLLAALATAQFPDTYQGAWKTALDEATAIALRDPTLRSRAVETISRVDTKSIGGASYFAQKLRKLGGPEVDEALVSAIERTMFAADREVNEGEAVVFAAELAQRAVRGYSLMEPARLRAVGLRLLRSSLPEVTWSDPGEVEEGGGGPWRWGADAARLRGIYGLWLLAEFGTLEDRAQLEFIARFDQPSHEPPVEWPPFESRGPGINVPRWATRALGRIHERLSPR